MATLPDDVLIKIFSRLPAKQAVQLRSISKHWNSHLSESFFTKSHLDHSIHMDKDEIFLKFSSYFSFKRKQFAAVNLRSRHLQLTNLIKLPDNTPSEDAGCHIIGSINGLICFYYNSVRTRVFNIWNPYLSALLALPPSGNPPSFYHYHIFFSFGFDPKTDDYKVVALKFRSGKENTRSGVRVHEFVPKECTQVEVYSMRKNSWKRITENFPSHVTRIYEDDYFCVHGHHDRVHWLGDLGEDRKRETIVTFDFGTETFSEISLPDCVCNRVKDHSVVLGYVAGKLCVKSRVRNGEFEVWVMDEYGVIESWVKHDTRDLIASVVEANVNPYKTMAMLLKETKFVRYVESLVWVSPTKSVPTVTSADTLVFANRRCLVAYSTDDTMVMLTIPFHLIYPLLC